MRLRGWGAKGMGVGKKSIWGAIFVAGNTYITLLVIQVTNIILMRLLLPEHYGVVALANFLVSLIMRSREWGFDYALMHKQGSLEKLASNHLSLQTGFAAMNLIVAGAVALALPALSRFEFVPNEYYDPTVLKVMVIFSAFAIFDAMATTPEIILQKELIFGRLIAFRFVQLAILTAARITMAFMGFGLWTLVIAEGIKSATALVGIWIISPIKPRFGLDREIVLWYFRFGFYMWLGGIATFIVYQFDDFLVGGMVGFAALGFYSRAYTLSKKPLELIAHVVTKVAWSTYARVQNDREKLSRAYSLVVGNIFRTVLPLATIMAVVAPEAIRLLFGEKWLPMVSMFRILVVYSALRPIFDNSDSLLTVTGRPKLHAAIVGAQAAILVILCPIFIHFYKADGAAVAVDIVMVTGVAMIYRSLVGYVDIDYKRMLIYPVISIALAVIITFLMNRLLFAPPEVKIIPMIVKIVVDGAILGIVYIGALLLLDGRRLFEDVRYLREVMSKG
ncbi:MAG: oligosaccharide flippase family protein [bacterium]